LSFEEMTLGRLASRWSWWQLPLARTACEMQTRIVSASEKRLGQLLEKEAFGSNGP
jgi:hypothetical protein